MPQVVCVFPLISSEKLVASRNTVESEIDMFQIH